MKLRPEGSKLLIEVDKVDERHGSLWIPKTVADAHQHTMTIGTVLAIGPGASCVFSAADGEEMLEADDEHENMRVLRIGDKIWFAKYGGVSFEYTEKGNREKDYRIINDEDVMAIIDGEIA